MPGRVGRRFTVADGMILVAAAGVAAMVVRDYLRRLEFLWDYGSGRYMPATWLQWLTGSIPILGALSSALLICRLLQPLPPRRRLWLLPGTTPGLAVTLGSLQVLAESLYAALKSWQRSLSPTSPLHGRIPYPFSLEHYEHRCEEIAGFVGFAVGITWLLLFLGGRWRVETSWVDRLGRALGVCWIALFFVLRWADPLRSF